MHTRTFWFPHTTAPLRKWNTKCKSEESASKPLPLRSMQSHFEMAMRGTFKTIIAFEWPSVMMTCSGTRNAPVISLGKRTHGHQLVNKIRWQTTPDEAFPPVKPVKCGCRWRSQKQRNTLVHIIEQEEPHSRHLAGTSYFCHQSMQMNHSRANKKTNFLKLIRGNAT